jgi:DNA-binding MarR family transcriptional regulator/GNAT superfamily N-acetyltransferase
MVATMAATSALEPTSELERSVGAVRRFNRLYTRRIGVLQESFLDTPYSLAECRVIYELAQRDKATATDVAAALGLDHGYLSRILRGFGERGLVARTASPSDRRQSLLSLTAKGRLAFGKLDQRSQDDVAAMLQRLSATDQARVVAAMRTLESLLGEAPATDAPYVLRPPRPGDMGWIVAQHGLVYGGEYGWDDRLEALTAEIVAAFVRDFDPRRERCWIAEMDGENVGTVMLVKDRPGVARLRLLLVDPKARGLGLGARLVDECIRFARRAGYRKITLWTHSVLTAARHIYEKAGFKLMRSEPHKSWGRPVVSEYWDLDL